MKALLAGFEISFGLKVNLFKSCLIEINVSSELMNMAYNFFNCCEGSIPFKYLGLPMGATVCWKEVGMFALDMHLNGGRI